MISIPSLRSLAERELWTETEDDERTESREEERARTAGEGDEDRTAPSGEEGDKEEEGQRAGERGGPKLEVVVATPFPPDVPERRGVKSKHAAPEFEKGALRPKGGGLESWARAPLHSSLSVLDFLPLPFFPFPFPFPLPLPPREATSLC